MSNRSYSPRHVRRRGARAALAAATILTCVVAVTACSSGAASEGAGTGNGTTPAPETLDLTLQTFPGLLVYLPEDIAVREGIFESNGLDVTIVNPGDGATMMRLLVSGDADGVQGTTLQAVTARAQGQPLGFVGSMWNTNSYQVVARDGIGSDKSDWDSKVRGLKGTTIGVGGIGGGADLLIRGILQDAGLDPDKDVTIVAVTSTAAAIAQLQQSAIDSFVRAIPAGEQIAKATGGHIYLDVAKEGPAKFANDPMGMITTEAFIEEEPETLARWIKSMEDALEWLRDPANADAAIALIAEGYTGGDEDLAESVLTDLIENVYSETLSGLEVPVEAVDNQIEAAEESGLIEVGQVKSSDVLLLQ